MVDDNYKEDLSSESVENLIGARRQFVDFVRKRVASAADAEDIVQNGFVRAIEKAGEIREDEKLIAWFYRVLRNAVIDYYRHRAFLDRVSEEIVRQWEREPQDTKDIEESVCRCLLPTLKELKPEYRQAIETVDIEEQNLASLAERAAITPATAAVRVHRARTALRKQVQLVCGTCATHGCVDCTCGTRP